MREREREREMEMERGRRERKANVLCRLFQLLDVQLTDLVVVVDSIDGVTEYLVEEWQCNNLEQGNIQTLPMLIQNREVMINDE